MQVAVGVGFLVQRDGVSRTQHQLDHATVFGFGAVAIHDALRLGEPCGFFNPILQWSRHFAPPASRRFCCKVSRMRRSARSPSRCEVTKRNGVGHATRPQKGWNSQARWAGAMLLPENQSMLRLACCATGAQESSVRTSLCYVTDVTAGAVGRA